VNWQLVQVESLGISCVFGSIDTLNEFCKSGQLPHVRPFMLGTNTYTSNNLMKMRRRVRAWVDEGVQALDGEASAPEPEQRVGRRQQP
jgi:hypothetical protein